MNNFHVFKKTYTVQSTASPTGIEPWSPAWQAVHDTNQYTIEDKLSSIIIAIIKSHIFAAFLFYITLLRKCHNRYQHKNVIDLLIIL